MTDGRFGAARRPEPVLVPETLEIGAEYIVGAGKLRGSKVVLEEIERWPLPSDGSTVPVARVRRPRAGVSHEFPQNLRRIEDG
jgi:hypothetical protein